MSATKAKVSAPVATPAVLTLAEAAAFLRVSEDALRQLATEQAVPARQIGGEWRLSRAALEAWLGQPCAECRSVERLLAEWERRAAANSVPTDQPRAANPANQKILELAGCWKDDPTVPDLLKEIYRARGRPLTEEDE